MFLGLSVQATHTRGRVTIRVTDAGVPVANSTVTVAGYLLHTGADGRAHIKLPRGSYRSQPAGTNTLARPAASESRQSRHEPRT
jgi:hypothetical protein